MIGVAVADLDHGHVGGPDLGPGHGPGQGRGTERGQAEANGGQGHGPDQDQDLHLSQKFRTGVTTTKTTRIGMEMAKIAKVDTTENV